MIFNLLVEGLPPDDTVVTVDQVFLEFVGEDALEG